jgi:amidohydrolase
LHRHPELAFAEVTTGQRIAERLKVCGCRVKTGVGRTGVVGELKGKSSTGPVVAVRADMDALPVTEKSGLPFASATPGLMHACGHDAHMAIAVSTAAILAELRDEWNGMVRLIFQPSEEVPPGGAAGMIADGVLANPAVDTIFGLHVDPWIPCGKVGLKDGAMMAQVDDFDLIITGKSGHGARPHLGRDAVYIASQVVSALQSIVSRTTDPMQPAVLSIGRIIGGVARNVVADEVCLEGTVRVLDAREGQRVRRRIETVAGGTARALGGRARLDYVSGYPVLFNDPKVNEYFRTATMDALGKKAVVEIPDAMLGAEDFARYLRLVPGAMMRLGVRNPAVGAVHAWHHPQFTIDEAALEIGCRVLTAAVFNRLTATAPVPGRQPGGRKRDTR